MEIYFYETVRILLGESDVSSVGLNITFLAIHGIFSSEIPFLGNTDEFRTRSGVFVKRKGDIPLWVLFLLFILFKRRGFHHYFSVTVLKQNKV